MRRTTLAAALALAAPAAAPAQVPGAPGLRVAPCTLPGAGAARCGSLEVWENRAARGGRKIRIRFAVLPATGTATADPVVPIAGGPGQASIPGASFLAEELAGLRGTRDILLVDARGTGRSNPLRCEMYGPALNDYLGDFYPAARVRRCAAGWSGRADLGQYTSDNAADDLDDVRAALGYRALNLYGTSYGTRTALVYMRRHPEHVRSAILHGVAHTGIRMPLRVAPDAQRAMEGVIGDCEREPACNAAFPGLRDDLRSAGERLARGPVEVTVADPVSGEPATFALTRDLFAEGLRYMTYSASSAAYVPAVLHQAGRGDLGPAAEQALYGRRVVLGDRSGAGLYLSITCAEDVPFFDEAEGVRLAAGSYLGDFRVRNQKAACAEWPVRPVGRAFLEPVRSDAPVLVLTGQWDPATPPAQGSEVLRTLPNGRQLVIPGAGHGFNGVAGLRECVPPLLVAFVRTANAKALDAGCIARIHRPPFPLRALPTRPVAVAAAELAGYTGTFASAAGMKVETKVENGRLNVLRAGRRFALLPVGDGVFRALGLAFVVVAFEREGGVVKTMVVEEGGSPTRYARQ
jgi:pimeloyl-ACP methyl ester carboxylesterase